MIPLMDKISGKDFLFMVESKIQDNIKLREVGLLKLYGMIFGLLIGAYFPHIVKMLLIPLIIFFLVLMSYFIYLLFKRDDTHL